MTNPYRAMCAELVAIEDALSRGSVQFSNQGQAIDGYSALATFRYVADKARILLAQQEPEGPTDEELLAMRLWSCHGPTFDSDLVDFARAVLAKWDHQ
jgi:hypothetical protein